MPRGKKRPHDEFKDWTVHALLWIRNNWKTTIEIVAIAAVVFAVMAGARVYWQHRSHAAADAFYKVQSIPPDSDERVKGLMEITSDYSRMPAGKQAMMKLGDAYLEREEYDKAKEQYRRLAGRSRNLPILRIAALHKLAEAEQAEGDSEAAAQTYLKAAADPGNELELISRLRAAVSFERAGRLKQAAGLYRQIIEEAGDGDLDVRMMSEERLLWLITNGHIDG